MMSRATFAEKATVASERAKEFISTSGGMVSRARTFLSGDAKFFSVQPKLEDLRRHLDSVSVQEKRDAMKRIIAQMCKGNDMSNLFADVVKNIHTPSIELRKLIYFYITHYAGDRPNEALLSISAFQKDLMDPSLHVRSLALRMLSAMRIPAIQPLVMVAVKKSASDLEPLVRKTAAISLAQMHAISNSDGDKETVRSLLKQLLEDKCTEVTSAAALSFIEICPDDMSLLHSVYRDLCRSLVDCEEWGQVVLLLVLLRYARTQFTDPNKPSKQSCTRDTVKEKKKTHHPAGDDNSEDREDVNKDKDDNESTSASLTSSSSSSSGSSSFSSSVLNPMGNGDDYEMKGKMDRLLEYDHRLLLDSVKPLFMSLNSAVVVAATSLFYHCAPRAELDICIRPLIRLLRGPQENLSIILSVIYTIVLCRPEPFIPFIKEFYLLPHDVKDVQELKIRVISKLVTMDNCKEVFREFRVYARSFHVSSVRNAVRGLGIIAGRLPTCASQIMRLLVPLMSHKNADIVSESISVLRLLVVQGSDTGRTCRLVYRLLHQVLSDEITGSSAKASILWLVGENMQRHTLIATAAPECFRVFVKKFTQESLDVRKQTLLLGCKIWLFLDGTSSMSDRFRKLFFYALELARFDEDYDVRDYGRLIQCTVNRQSDTFAALKNIFFGEKPMPQSNDSFVEHTQYQLGTMSHLFGKPLFGYKELPPWADVTMNSLLRGAPHGNDNDSSNNNSSDDDDELLHTSETEVSSSLYSSYTHSGTASDTTDDDDDDVLSRSASTAEMYEEEDEEDDNNNSNNNSSQQSSSASSSSSHVVARTAGVKGGGGEAALRRFPVKIPVRYVDPHAGAASVCAENSATTVDDTCEPKLNKTTEAVNSNNNSNNNNNNNVLTMKPESPLHETTDQGKEEKEEESQSTPVEQRQQDEEQ